MENKKIMNKKLSKLLYISIIILCSLSASIICYNYLINQNESEFLLDYHMSYADYSKKNAEFLLLKQFYSENIDDYKNNIISLNNELKDYPFYKGYYIDEYNLDSRSGYIYSYDSALFNSYELFDIIEGQGLENYSGDYYPILITSGEIGEIIDVKIEQSDFYYEDNERPLLTTIKCEVVGIISKFSNTYDSSISSFSNSKIIIKDLFKILEDKKSINFFKPDIYRKIRLYFDTDHADYEDNYTNIEILCNNYGYVDEYNMNPDIKFHKYFSMIRLNQLIYILLIIIVLFFILFLIKIDIKNYYKNIIPIVFGILMLISYYFCSRITLYFINFKEYAKVTIILMGIIEFAVMLYFILKKIIRKKKFI